MKARHVLAVTNDDAINTEVIVQARQLHAEGGRGQLRCLARVGDPELCTLLRLQESNADDGLPPLDYFNFQEVAAPTHARGASLHDGRWFAAPRCGRPRQARPVARAPRGPHVVRGPSGERTAPLRVSVLDDDAEARVRVAARQPSRAPPRLRVRRVRDSDGRGAPPARFARRTGGVPAATIAYLGDYRDDQALELALTLRRLPRPTLPSCSRSRRATAWPRCSSRATPRHRSSPTSGCSRSSTGPARSISSRAGRSRCSPTRSTRAGSRQRTASGNEATTWDDLDESRRNSSRDQARGIATKLHSIGCEIGPLSDWDANEFRFTDVELEQLAEQEHDALERGTLSATAGCSTRAPEGDGSASARRT